MPRSRYIGYEFTGTANSTVVTPALNGGVTDKKYNSGVWTINGIDESSVYGRRKQGNWLTSNRGSGYLGAKIFTSNTSITFPADVGFAVVKLWGGYGAGVQTPPVPGGPGNYRQGGFTAIKLGANSAGQTYYITNDGTDAPWGTFVTPAPGHPGFPGPPYTSNDTLGGGYVSISTGPMAPGAGPAPTRQGTVLGLAGGSGSGNRQSGSAGGSAGYPLGGNGTDYNPNGQGGLGAGQSAPPSPNGPAGTALRGGLGQPSPPPNPGVGGGGGHGYVGGSAGGSTPDGGGRGGGGGGSSNYIVSPDNDNISGIANSTYSHPIGYDTFDPDFSPTHLNPQDRPGLGPASVQYGSGGYAVIKFFETEQPDYDAPYYPSSIPTDF